MSLSGVIALDADAAPPTDGPVAPGPQPPDSVVAADAGEQLRPRGALDDPVADPREAVGSR